jgi:CheY-like chemotaxis protein
MGLAIVKRLAALLGHHLEVASIPGRGTRFRIGIAIGGLPGIQEDMAPADTRPMQLDLQQMVLVVDDEEPIREGLRLLLQDWGFHAMTACDAAQAEQVTVALEGRVDLILTDLHLGSGPDGMEVVSIVRRLCGRDVPAILVTGDAAPDRSSHVTEGDCAVLIKPVQPMRLFQAMRAALS